MRPIEGDVRRELERLCREYAKYNASVSESLREALSVSGGVDGGEEIWIEVTYASDRR